MKSANVNIPTEIVNPSSTGQNQGAEIMVILGNCCLFIALCAHFTDSPLFPVFMGSKLPVFSVFGGPKLPVFPVFGGPKLTVFLFLGYVEACFLVQNGLFFC